MDRAWNIRFNKTSLTERWAIEDALTFQLFTAESVFLEVPSSTVNDDPRTLFSIRAHGVLVWEGKKAIIKER